MKKLITVIYSIIILLGFVSLFVAIMIIGLTSGKRIIASMIVIIIALQFIFFSMIGLIRCLKKNEEDLQDD